MCTTFTVRLRRNCCKLIKLSSTRRTNATRFLNHNSQLETTITALNVHFLSLSFSVSSTILVAYDLVVVPHLVNPMIDQRMTRIATPTQSFLSYLVFDSIMQHNSLQVPRRHHYHHRQRRGKQILTNKSRIGSIRVFFEQHHRIVSMFSKRRRIQILLYVRHYV